MLAEKIHEEIKKLQGPIVVFGAGGFIGANLVHALIKYRQDVYAVTSKPFIPWRLNDMEESHVIHCDITDSRKVSELFEKFNFKTVFDFAAYGAYSKQDDLRKIYQTNFMGLVNLLESASRYHIHAIVHAGSSSEYGLHCAAPDEKEYTQPNSHYAVSKSSAAELIKYYGTIKGIPVCNLRFYSIYGPYEEPDRLVPMMISKGLEGTYPPLVQPDISRDFVYVDDAVYASLLAANCPDHNLHGRSVNIASSQKTTIREMALLSKELFNLSESPKWGEMPDRKWDLKDWYGKATLAKELLGWESHTSLKEGFSKTIEWQRKFSKPLYEKKIYQDKIRHKLTAVIACYKDEQAIPFMHQRLTATFTKLNVD